MQEKYTYGLWGAAIGALAMTLVLPFGFGWMTAGGSAREANTAVSGVLLPICADAILANPAAVAELKTKRPADYDDVVKAHLQTIGEYKTSYIFWRACGKVIEARLSKSVVR